MRLEEARAIGEELKAMMERAGVATDIVIAGSVRRLKPEPKDVELVFRPVFREEADPEDLFGTTRPINQQLKWVKGLIGTTLFHRPDRNDHACCGPGIQRLLYKGVPVDLFGVIPPASYGITLFVRTGPAEFNVRTFQRAAARGMRVAGGRLWQGGRYIPTDSEREVFAAIGMPFPDPWRRQ